ncbi:MAG: hypothetical protein GX319_07860 [Clostridiales bacterium]|jgi:hypothetical protein|nr:hypothetical protein [Bacillota bacterium]NLK04309.1 hypothetical protein [Clostridiales bacterium]
MVESIKEVTKIIIICKYHMDGDFIMDSNLYIIIFLLLLGLFNDDKKFLIARKIKMKNKKERKFMEDFVKQFVGKFCVIHMMSSLSTVEGTIRDVSDNGILLEDKKNKFQVINLDFVARIQDKSKNK